MEVGAWFYIFSGLWAVGMITALVAAIRLSYRIEQRSDRLRNRTGLPMYAAMPFTVTNWRVSRDAETQALRRRMLKWLGLNLLGFALFGAVVLFALPA
ncbi:hypothetical protein EJC49_01645 [Aquibium carbonis]|uniref:Uncharacterized protein n=1 Tax=Aquibium carbonis TaxID=2495581 RepID=A0A429Z3B0_9HYPH|nr:hypothetical protein [Aquibium carbonis]RST88177.1 hypothetical protein EJC49_01645 [Aquibium carbonis]